jgi:two-component system, sensor histidine kinase PdtaS
LGLITTELVINALKHAFPSGEGNVKVTYENNAKQWKLSISDDGVGLAATTVKANGEGLGTNIIDSLAKQLEADVHRVSSAEGTLISISHPRTIAVASPEFGTEAVRNS